jgi:hypothetical protein
MNYFLSSFRNTESTKSRRQVYQKEKGCSTEPLLDTKVWSVSFTTFPSDDISASVATVTSLSSIETSPISYYDYPSYPNYKVTTDDLPLEVDGVMAMKNSAWSGVASRLRRRVSGSLLSWKKGVVKRMAKRKYKGTSSTNETSDPEDESISTNELIESVAKRRKISAIPRLWKKMLEWAKSITKNASRSVRLDSTDDAVDDELGVMGTRPKASRKFSPLECNSASYDVDVMF